MNARAPHRIGILNDVPAALRVPNRIDWMRAALDLAFEEALAAGRLDRPVELVIRGGEGLPVGTAANVSAAFAELEAAGVLGIIGPAITDNALITQPMAEAAQLPTLNWSGSEHTRGAYGFHFQLGSLPEEGPLLARWLAANKLRTVAVVRDRSPIALEYFEYFQRAADRLDLDVVADVRCAVMPDDPEAVVARAQRSGAEALVCLGLLMAVPEIARARRRLGWQAPVLANTSLLRGYTDPETLWPLFEGWIYVDMVDEHNTVQADLFHRLAEHTGRTPAGPTAAAGFDMGQLIAEGLALAPEFTRDGLRIGLERIKGLPAASGGAGTVMTLGPWDHAALKGPNFLVLRQVRDGQSRPL